MPGSVKVPRVSLSIKPLSQVRAAAKPGNIGHLNALRLIHTNPNTLRPTQIFLGKIAQGEIIFPPALLTKTLATLKDLGQNEKVDILAQAAYKVVAVETLIQAKKHGILLPDTQNILMEIGTGDLVLYPELVDEAVAAIKLLPVADNSNSLALEVLQPAPAVPAITPPVLPETSPTPAVHEPFVPQLFEKVTLPPPPSATSNEQLATILPFTIKVANGNGGKTYTYYTYPKVDYRPFVKDGVRFSDLDQMALDRQNLETSLGTMWCALSALGSRKGHVTRWLTEISQLINTVSTDYGQKIKALEQAKDLTIGFFIKANDIVSKADVKIAEVKSPVKKEHESPSEWLIRRRNERDLVWDIETQAIQDLQANEQALSAKLQQLGMENAFDQLIRLDVSAAENYFNALISHLNTERDKKVQEISVSRNTVSLEQELEQIIKDLELVNTHRRPTLVQLENLRQISAQIRARIMPKLDAMEAVPVVPEEGKAAAAEDEIITNWPRPPIAGVPNQVEIDRLTAKVVELETKLAEAKKLADYIKGRSASNDQFIVVENGTKYHIGDKVMGGEVKFLYTWEGKNMAIVVSTVPMRTPAEIEKELTETKDRLAALQRENEELRQRVAAVRQAAEQPEQQKDVVISTPQLPTAEEDLFTSLVVSLKSKGFKAGRTIKNIEEIGNDQARKNILQIALQLSQKGIDPQNFTQIASVFEWTAEQYRDIVNIVNLIINSLPDSLIENSLRIIKYYRNVSNAAPFLLDLFYQNIINLIENGQDPYNVIFSAMIRSFMRLPDKQKDELKDLLETGKSFSPEFETLMRQQINLPKNQSGGNQ